MNIVSFILDIIAVSIVTFLFLSRYINLKNNHVPVLIVTYIAWYFPFLILFVLPLDVSNTYYQQCLNNSVVENITLVRDNSSNATTIAPAPGDECYEPLIGAPSGVLYILWQVVYWSSQVLTWLVLPLMQSYANAGDFTVLGKMKTSVISNALYYGSYLLLAGIFLIVLVAKGFPINGPSLYTIAVTASNTWGLFCLVFLLGYGLVEVPRVCWRRGNIHNLLKESYFKVAKLSLEKSEAEDDLNEIADIIKRTSITVNSSRSDLAAFVKIMVDKLPEGVASRMNRRGATSRARDESVSNDVDLLGDVTQAKLAKLHKKLIKTLRRFSMAQTRWDAAVSRSLHYEDTVNSLATTGFFHRTTGSYKGCLKILCTPSVEWYWRCLIQPWGFRFLAIILAVCSIFVVWSEVVFWCPEPVLSLYAIFMDEAAKNHAFVALELLTAFTVAYLSICAYYTIFKVRIFSYYHMSPHHNTDENSLIFSGMLLCRFTPALCLNYLSLIHLEPNVNPNLTVWTAYSKIMGQFKLVWFISQGFNIYFPIAILLLCFCTIFSIGSRILHALGFQQFIGEDDMTKELIEEGHQLISRERGYLDRAVRRDERRKELENLGVYPRNADGASTSSTADIIRRRNYMDPGASSDNFMAGGGGGSADPYLNSFPGATAPINSGMSSDRLLGGPTEPPVYTQTAGSNMIGRPVPSNTGQSSRNLFDDI